MFSYVTLTDGHRKAVPVPVAQTLQHAIDVKGTASIIIKGVTHVVKEVVITKPPRAKAPIIHYWNEK